MPIILCAFLSTIQKANVYIWDDLHYIYDLCMCLAYKLHTFIILALWWAYRKSIVWKMQPICFIHYSLPTMRYYTHTDTQDYCEAQVESAPHGVWCISKDEDYLHNVVLKVNLFTYLVLFAQESLQEWVGRKDIFRE